jgi:hypothetical protein
MVMEMSPPRRLYVAPILAARPGRFDVHVYGPDGNRLASARVEVTPPRHPWTRFVPPEQAEGELTTAAPGDGGLFVAHVRAAEDGPWAPYWRDGADPLFAERAVLLAGGAQVPFPPPRTPLPRFIPDEPSPSLRLAAAGNTVTITSERTILVSRPDNHFLVRWWIKGKPFVPRPLLVLEATNGLMVFGKRIRLTVDLPADRFGAKSGDEVRLQLLYCPYGTQPAGEDLAMKIAMKLADWEDKDSPHLPILSNVASFRVP